MDIYSDTYKTLARPSEVVLYKNSRSKFYGYAFPIKSETEVKPILDDLRKKHHTANHVCYAWQLGAIDTRYRAYDDGEPHNSAGMAIYGQLQSFEVTDLLVVVVRIFGGTKLGLAGLTTAYRTTALMTLEMAAIVTRTLQRRFVLSFDYPLLDVVMRTIKQHQMEIITQEMAMDCKLVVSVREMDADRIKEEFKAIYGLRIKKIGDPT